MASTVKKYFLTDAGDLVARLVDPGLRIIDCSFSLLDTDAGRRDYLNLHIPGAVYADLDLDLAAPISNGTGRHPLPEISLLVQKLEEWGVSRETEVVVYDLQNGVMASRLWWMLKWLGHDNVTLLDGGMSAWLSAGLPLEQGNVYHRRAEFVVDQQDGMFVSTGEILEGIQQHNLPILVDAREHERFIGDEEPIDPVAGHIPGAVSFPFADSLASDGRWLPHNELRERWKPVLEPARDAGWIAMCGSGVTACHLALSAQYAGFAAPRVYTGSWSEWILDPERPRIPD